MKRVVVETVSCSACAGVGDVFLSGAKLVGRTFTDAQVRSCRVCLGTGKVAQNKKREVAKPPPGDDPGPGWVWDPNVKAWRLE